MDWALAIARNHGALVRLVTALFAVVGLVPDGAPVASMSPSIRSKIIRVLRPAESALRRLIAIAAQGVDGAVRSRQSGKKRRKTEGKRKRGTRAPIFRLFDPRKWFPELSKGRRPARGPGPRITDFDDDSWEPYEQEPAKEPANPAGLCRRLQALHRALQDIPGQALRLARVQHRRRAAKEPLSRTEPLRPGLPPGHRKHETHEIDEVLNDCDILARMEPKPPDLARFLPLLLSSVPAGTGPLVLGLRCSSVCQRDDGVLLGLSFIKRRRAGSQSANQRAVLLKKNR